VIGGVLVKSGIIFGIIKEEDHDAFLSVDKCHGRFSLFFCRLQFIVYLCLSFLNNVIMAVFSSAELRNNVKRHLAATKPIAIQRGRAETFTLQTEKHLAPDADLSRAITLDELLVGVKEDLRAMFKK
jgi:hypothetical protein